jgi:hypothetical protein
LKPRASPAELFERQVQHDISGCWVWTGYRNRGGYGVVKQRGKQLLAHRLSWVLAHGDLPPSLHVLHRCDNRACVRPDHLFLGSNRDNVADRIAKGRPGGRPHTGSNRRSSYRRPKRRAESIEFGDLVLYKGKAGWRFVSHFNNIPPVNSRRYCAILNTKTGKALSVRRDELEPAPKRR